MLVASYVSRKYSSQGKMKAFYLQLLSGQGRFNLFWPDLAPFQGVHAKWSIGDTEDQDVPLSLVLTPVCLESVITHLLSINAVDRQESFPKVTRLLGDETEEGSFENVRSSCWFL